jgi:hypothetical protein
MHYISDALRSARTAIEHPQCGRALPGVVAEPRPFADGQASAIPLAILHHPKADAGQKADAATLLATWDARCGHWRHDRLNGHNATPQLPPEYRDWQPYLAA